MTHVNVHTEFGQSSATAELDKLAKAYATEHKVEYAVAYDKVLQSSEGSKLYTKSRNERVVAAPSEPKPLSKREQAVITANTTFVELAKAYHPGLSEVDATVEFLKTPLGKRHYTDFLQETRYAQSA